MTSLAASSIPRSLVLPRAAWRPRRSESRALARSGGGDRPQLIYLFSHAHLPRRVAALTWLTIHASRWTFFSPRLSFLGSSRHARQPLQIVHGTRSERGDWRFSQGAFSPPGRRHLQVRPSLCRVIVKPLVVALTSRASAGPGSTGPIDLVALAPGSRPASGSLSAGLRGRARTLHPRLATLAARVTSPLWRTKAERCLRGY